MAMLAQPLPGYGRDDRFFLTMAIVMAVINVLGFSMQLAMGRSSFGAPALVHLHALVFFGWVVLYLLQNVFVYRGVMGLHRTLGWIGAVWMVMMVIVGTAVTVAMVRRGGVPFFFTPGYFLIMNPMSVLSFAGLTSAAIVLRKQTGWHRRLHYCGMALLLGPAIGRILPLPFLIPWAGMAVFAAIIIFPLIGVAADLRRGGRVHPGWIWGIGAMVATQLIIEVVPRTPLGAAIYNGAAAGTPGAAIPRAEYPPFPPMA